MCRLYAFSNQAYIETQLGVKNTNSSVTNYVVTLQHLMQRQPDFSVKRRCRSETRDPFVSWNAVFLYFQHINWAVAGENGIAYGGYQAFAFLR